MFCVLIWNKDNASWDIHSKGIHCAELANRTVDRLFDSGCFARVVRQPQ